MEEYTAMDSKKCTNCGKFKTIDSFTPVKAFPLGRAACKKCRAKKQKEEADNKKLASGLYKKCPCCSTLIKEKK